MGPVSIHQQIACLSKGLAELIREEDLRERLKESRPLRVKAGFDPTAPDLHLGHTVLLRKMKHFQEFGHTIIFVVGDTTGMIGDPTGRNLTRPPMTREEINRNAETYTSQVYKILDPAQTEIRFNSEWLDPLHLQDIIRLASKYTVARMLERDDFSKRLKDGTPVSMHELLYPLAQAYDSVAIRCDVEMGGTDQKFNLLVGREIQRDYGQPPQIVATTPLLEGLDGVNKMSKSLANYVGITESPEEMFKKLMSISDELMYRYYELLTDLSLEEIRQLRKYHPKQVKMDLARRIIADYHSREDAERAAGEWERVVGAGEVPCDIETVKLEAGPIRVDKMLARSGLAESVSDAVRKIKSGAVEINGSRVSELIQLHSPGEYTVRVGKKWRRVVA